MGSYKVCYVKAGERWDYLTVSPEDQH